MDPTRFDHLTRVLSGSGGRRAVLRALVAVVLGGATGETAAKRRGKGQHKDKRKGTGQDTVQVQVSRPGKGKGKGKGKSKGKKKKGKQPGPQAPSQPSVPSPAPGCCGTASCADPQPGGIHSGCNYAGQVFVGADHHGAHLDGIDGRAARFTASDHHGAILDGACLQGASFRRANLRGTTWDGSCLVGADLTGADLGGSSAVLDRALFCNTTMPDGSVSDRDCAQATSCCPTRLASPAPPCQSAADCPDEACRTVACQGGQCVYAVVADGPSSNDECGTDSSGHCCEGDCCLPGATECNSLGLCCAPNCTGRECGEDGCGNANGCGICPEGKDCDQATGQCVCDGQSCPDGCCDASGDCIRPGNTLQRCGTGGAACETCSSAEICQNGQCVTCAPNCTCTGQDACASPGQPPANTICGLDLTGANCHCMVSRAGQPFCGGPGQLSGCRSDADCDGVGPGAFCVNAAPTGSICPTIDTFCAAPCCNAQTCPDGCCDEFAVCQLGNTFSDCGTGGGRCASCNQNQSCLNQQCAPCSLSCDDLDHSCGPDGCGGSCGVCFDGRDCVDGICVCTAQSCPNGCCPGGIGNPEPCIPLSEQTDAECGLGGSCQSCVFGELCVNGACVCQPQCFGNTCGTDSCGNPTGCGTCPSGQTCTLVGQTMQCVG